MVEVMGEWEASGSAWQSRLMAAWRVDVIWLAVIFSPISNRARVRQRLRVRRSGSHHSAAGS